MWVYSLFIILYLFSEVRSNLTDNWPDSSQRSLNTSEKFNCWQNFFIFFEIMNKSALQSTTSCIVFLLLKFNDYGNGTASLYAIISSSCGVTWLFVEMHASSPGDYWLVNSHSWCTIDWSIHVTTTKWGKDNVNWVIMSCQGCRKRLRAEGANHTKGHQGRWKRIAQSRKGNFARFCNFFRCC